MCLQDYTRINSLPEDKILDLSKLKAFADDNLNVTQMTQLVLHRKENIVGKEENAGYHFFLLFLQFFKRFLFWDCEKLGL